MTSTIPFDQGITALPYLWDWSQVGTTPEGLAIIRAYTDRANNVYDAYVFGQGGLRELNAYRQYGTGPMPGDASQHGGERYYTPQEWSEHVVKVYEQMAPGASIYTTTESGVRYRSGGDSDKMRAAGWEFVPNVDWVRNGVTWGDEFARLAVELQDPLPPLVTQADKIADLERRIERIEVLLGDEA